MKYTLEKLRKLCPSSFSVKQHVVFIVPHRFLIFIKGTIDYLPFAKAYLIRILVWKTDENNFWLTKCICFSLHTLYNHPQNLQDGGERKPIGALLEYRV